MTHPEALIAIYQNYPRRIARRKALLEIERAIKRLISIEEGPMSEDEAIRGLLAMTCRYAASPAGNRGGFTPHPTTWFHQSRYLDDPREWSNVPDADAQFKTTAELIEAGNKSAFERARQDRLGACSNGDAHRTLNVARENQPVALRSQRLLD